MGRKLKSNVGILSQMLLESGLCKSGKSLMDCGVVRRLWLGNDESHLIHLICVEAHIQYR